MIKIKIKNLWTFGKNAPNNTFTMKFACTSFALLALLPIAVLAAPTQSPDCLFSHSSEFGKVVRCTPASIPTHALHKRGKSDKRASTTQLGRMQKRLKMFNWETDDVFEFSGAETDNEKETSFLPEIVVNQAGPSTGKTSPASTSFKGRKNLKSLFAEASSLDSQFKNMFIGGESVDSEFGGSEGDELESELESEVDFDRLKAKTGRNNRKNKNNKKPRNKNKYKELNLAQRARTHAIDIPQKVSQVLGDDDNDEEEDVKPSFAGLGSSLDTATDFGWSSGGTSVPGFTTQGDATKDLSAALPAPSELNNKFRIGNAVPVAELYKIMEALFDEVEYFIEDRSSRLGSMFEFPPTEKNSKLTEFLMKVAKSAYKLDVSYSNERHMVVVKKTKKSSAKNKNMSARFGLTKGFIKKYESAQKANPASVQTTKTAHIPKSQGQQAYKTEKENKQALGKNSPIDETNRGFQLLQKNGWVPGTALGKDGTGISEPITQEMRPKKQGLGYSGPAK